MEDTFDLSKQARVSVAAVLGGRTSIKFQDGDRTVVVQMSLDQFGQLFRSSAQELSRVSVELWGHLKGWVGAG